MRQVRPVLLALLGLLAACSAEREPDRAQLEARRPADARLAALYERSCLLCHARPESGAPLTGQASAWAPRLARGLDALVASSRQGLGGMPAMGLCAECSDADLRALIEFMSSKENTP